MLKSTILILSMIMIVFLAYSLLMQGPTADT